MSKITEQLCIGDINQANDMKWLKSQHITHVVNATMEIPDFFPKDFVYLNLGMDDIRQQSLSPYIEKAFRFITDAIGKGGTVFVHCHAGISRSSSVVIYFIMKVKGWNFYQALQYLRQRHPRANPNPGFVSQLRSVNAGQGSSPQGDKYKTSQSKEMQSRQFPMINERNHYTGEEEYVTSAGLYTPFMNGNTKYANLSTMNNSGAGGRGSYYW